MGIFKDFSNRKKIQADVLTIVDSRFNESTMKKLGRTSDKKSRKMLEQAVLVFRDQLVIYVKEQKLGLLGKSRVVKVAQDELISRGFDVDLVRGIIEKILVG